MVGFLVHGNVYAKQYQRHLEIQKLIITYKHMIGLLRL